MKKLILILLIMLCVTMLVSGESVNFYNANDKEFEAFEDALEEAFIKFGFDEEQKNRFVIGTSSKEFVKLFDIYQMGRLDLDIGLKWGGVDWSREIKGRPQARFESCPWNDEKERRVPIWSIGATSTDRCPPDYLCNIPDYCGDTGSTLREEAPEQETDFCYCNAELIPGYMESFLINTVGSCPADVIWCDPSQCREGGFGSIICMP